MSRPKPIATRVCCAAALLVFLIAVPGSPSPRSFAALLLGCALMPAVGVWIDWIRLERPTADDAFFAGATIAGALVLGIAPSGVTALWHPVLLAVGLTLALRKRVVAGPIVDLDGSRLTLALDHGRLAVERDAHDALGQRSPLVLEKGARLALTTRVDERDRGEGPFRSARVLGHGPILDVGSSADELRRRRRRRLLSAVGMVAVSAVIGWGVALAHAPVVSCHHP